MKHIFTLFFIIFTTVSYSQVPSNYYDSANGLSGYTLKSQLYNILTNGDTDRGYGALYSGYESTHSDNRVENGYENDNTVLLFYTENPNGSDAYEYNHGSRQCGNYNSEDDCYNREHIVPQSSFGSADPMQNDIHHVIPSDGYVNGQRGSLPFGTVGSANWTSQNGSKRGTSSVAGYGGQVFEPIDEFKGDIARMLLYFAVRYEDEVTDSSWDNHTTTNNPLNGTIDQVYETWYLQLLYKWHNEDQVSDREILRNNEAYDFQGNRNPFIDHPEYVENIWGSVLSDTNYSLDKKTSIYPNPATENYIYVRSNEKVTVKIFSLLGKKLIQNIIEPSNNKMDISIIKSGVYIIKISNNSSSITRKFIKK